MGFGFRKLNNKVVKLAKSGVEILASEIYMRFTFHDLQIEK